MGRVGLARREHGDDGDCYGLRYSFHSDDPLMFAELSEEEMARRRFRISRILAQ